MTYVVNCCLWQVTMRTSKWNTSSSSAYAHAFLLSWILSDYLARNKFKIWWNRWQRLLEQALLQHGPKHLRRGKERERRIFFYLQELISCARNKEHLCPPEDPWEALAGQPEDLCSCFCPSCIWINTSLLDSIGCPGIDIFWIKSWPK